eukprot:gene1198-1511_t
MKFNFLILLFLIIQFVDGQLTEAQRKEIVDVHNKVRSLAGITHGPTPTTPLNTLQWDPELEKEMQEFVSKCKFATVPESSFGVNGYAIWRSSTAFFNAHDVLERSFNKSAPLYDWDTKNCYPDQCCSVYPTMVWNATKSIGCGKMDCAGGSVLFVCAYNPMGNFPGVSPYKAAPKQPNTEYRKRDVPLPTSPFSNDDPNASPKPIPNLNFDSLYDWRKNGQVTKVKNQGSCGSCWAFASSAIIESAYLISSNKPHQELDLSEQHFVDCTNNGCNGGNARVAFDTLQETGIMLEKDYPYKGVTGWCPNINSTTIKWAGLDDIPASKENFLDALKSGPLYASVFADDGFQRYKSGVYKCGWNSQPNHAITIIGYDDKSDAWIIKNSWGPQWGESGFMRLSSSSCSIYKYPAAKANI